MGSYMNSLLLSSIFLLWFFFWIEDKVNDFGMPIICPHDYMVCLGNGEIGLSKLKDIKDDDKWRWWFKEEKEFDDKEAYVQKEEHYSIRR